MRELAIIKADGTLDECTTGIVQACMMYPDDEASIEEDVGAYRMRAASGFRETQLGRRLHAEWKSSWLGGEYAGCVLFKMLVFDTFRPDLKISVNKATFAVYTEMHQQHRGYERDLSRVKHFWSQYKNSAHLWASFMLTFNDSGAKLPVDFKIVVDRADFFAVSASRFLGDWSPWRAPNGFVFDGKVPLIEPPTPDQISVVQSYRVGRK